MDELKLVYLLKKKMEVEDISLDKSIMCQDWREFQRIIGGKFLICFGVGELFEYFCKKYSNNYEILYAVDNNISKGEKCGVQIYKPQILKENRDNCVVLIMTINHVDEIYRQVRAMGIQNIFSFAVLEYNRPAIHNKVKRAIEDFEYGALLQLRVEMKRAEDKISILENKCQSLQKRCEGLQKRCEGLQERQTARYFYLLHTNRVLNVLIEKSGDDELKKEQMQYLFREVFKNKYPLDLSNPKTYNEKMLACTLNDHNPLYTQITDKYLLKKYVAERVGEKYIVPLLGVWDSAEEVSFDELPEQFVIKSNIGGDSNKVILIKNKLEIDLLELKNQMKLWEYPYQNDYYYNFNWPFKNIEFKIIAEEYLPVDGLPYYDYKVHCFHGNPLYIHVVAHDPHEVTYYDLEWKKQDFWRCYPPIHYEIPKPDCLDEMIDLSRKLSEPFDYMRVDFYVAKDKLYVGELTLTSFGALVPFEPADVDFEWGKLI